MAILVTGGAGYIGSHTCVELLDAGYDVVVVDNLSNSKLEAVRRVQEISGRELSFYETDIIDREGLERVFCENSIDAVMHFAGLKAVGESVVSPIRYYQNNVAGTIVLCEVMQSHGVKRMVFSSSATVYGMHNISPLTEDMPLAPVNPYGRTKLIIEDMLRDAHVSDYSWGIALLRYFNPIGAHESGMIGDDPRGIPNNLMPYITQVAVGKRERLSVFGGDYDTHDGTGVRDYIHVVDLAKGHIRALEKIMGTQGAEAYNLGTGRGCSVLEVLSSFEKATGLSIPYVMSDRRPGDVSVYYADTSKACAEFGWRAEKSLEDMCRDSWNWQSRNPKGYE